MIKSQFESLVEDFYDKKSIWKFNMLVNNFKV